MIKFLVMDVDGTLTDGKVYMGNDGELFKAFDIKDGYGIRFLLAEKGIVPIVITARNSRIVDNRCKEMAISEIHQGVMVKMDCLKDILISYSQKDQFEYSLSCVAYIGDDLLDLQCMIPIKNAGGIIGCPADAVTEVKNICEFVSHHKGGDGAVREFVEYIIKK